MALAGVPETLLQCGPSSLPQGGQTDCAVEKIPVYIRAVRISTGLRYLPNLVVGMSYTSPSSAIAYRPSRFSLTGESPTTARGSQLIHDLGSSRVLVFKDGVARECRTRGGATALLVDSHMCTKDLPLIQTINWQDGRGCGPLPYLVRRRIVKRSDIIAATDGLHSMFIAGLGLFEWYG